MKLQKTHNQRRAEQFFVGIPSKIVKAFGWKGGEELKMEIMGKDKLKLEKVK